MRNNHPVQVDSYGVRSLSRRSVLAGTGAIVVASGAAALLGSAAAASAGDQVGVRHGGGPGATVVLVHGAFADGSSWSGVTSRLQQKGYSVIAAPNPLRGLRYDSAYVANLIAGLPAPVVLVGHSYGGAVITNAATEAANVTALVYVAAVAPDVGETLAGLAAQFPPSDLNKNLKPKPFTNPDGSPGIDLYVDREKFAELFAADVPRRAANAMAAAQRPLAANALNEPSGPPAWKQIPSWYAVSTRDRAIPPDGQRLMAARIKAATIELQASHAVMVSRPARITALIETAVRTAAGRPTGLA